MRPKVRPYFSSSSEIRSTSVPGGSSRSTNPFASLQRIRSFRSGAMLHALAASFERRRARQRTYDALLLRARRGHVTGGMVYGYVNHPVLAGGRRAHVEHVIEPREAAVVRTIFEHAAMGWGVKRIAAALNAEAAPPPVPRRPGQRPGWAPSSVREILHRELYRGVVVWGRTEKVVRRGTKHQRDRTAGEALQVEVPALRVVDEALWQRAHERRNAGRALYLAANKGRAFGRLPSGRESPYLLTGLGTCAVCGGSMCVLTRSHGRQRVPFWGCMTRKQRGEAVCPNRLEVPLEATDHAVLKSVEHDVLRVEVLETTLYKVLVLLDPPRDEAEEESERGLRAELARLDTEVGRLTGAIAAGGELPALLAGLQDRERRRAHLRAELAGLERERAGTGTFDVERVLDELRGALTDWQGLLRQETGPARQALSALLAGRLIFTPDARDGERFYTFSGQGTITPVLAGMVSLQRVWCPRRDTSDGGDGADRPGPWHRPRGLMTRRETSAGSE